jgi:uncharacterized membrane protein YhaH (DUF805 family)
VTLGAGELLLIAVLMGEQSAADALRPAVVLLILLNLVVLALLVADIRPFLSRLYDRRTFGAAVLFVLLTWLVIPAGALLAGTVPATASITIASLILASLGVRYAIVRLPREATRRGVADEPQREPA